MRSAPLDPQRDSFANLEGSAIRVLSPREERSLLHDLAACKVKLAQALAGIEGIEAPKEADDPQALARFISTAYSTDGAMGARLGAIYRTYCELRSRLALANLRLVAHVAKRFRDRGIPYSDLMQEGFCGLLESIDRFDMTHQTKLATYATWWIRQSMQRAVASGAYPVRLTPRHLRQLAQSQEESNRRRWEEGARVKAATVAGGALIDRILTATLPTISLDATIDQRTGFSLLQTISDPEGDRCDDRSTEEAIARLLRGLRPREQQVLSLRFGLLGQDRLSLSQVGRALQVSKERVRQIQDRALEKLRELAEKENLVERLALAD